MPTAPKSHRICAQEGRHGSQHLPRMHYNMHTQKHTMPTQNSRKHKQVATPACKKTQHTPYNNNTPTTTCSPQQHTPHIPSCRRHVFLQSTLKTLPRSMPPWIRSPCCCCQVGARLLEKVLGRFYKIYSVEKAQEELLSDTPHPCSTIWCGVVGGYGDQVGWIGIIQASMHMLSCCAPCILVLCITHYNRHTDSIQRALCCSCLVHVGSQCLCGYACRCVQSRWHLPSTTACVHLNQPPL